MDALHSQRLTLSHQPGPTTASSQSAEAAPPAPRPAGHSQAPAVSSDHRRQRFFVQAEIGRQMFQPPVLVFHCLQPLRVADVHTALL